MKRCYLAGPMVELAWADASRKPVIICMEAKGNPHDGLHVRGLATYIVNSLDEGIDVARCFFNAPEAMQVFHGLDEDGKDLPPPLFTRNF